MVRVPAPWGAGRYVKASRYRATGDVVTVLLRPVQAWLGDRLHQLPDSSVSEALGGIMVL
jgi:hypothetical protein